MAQKNRACLQNVELGLKHFHPLHLSGGAFAVYQHLPEEEKFNIAQIKHALQTAFATDSFMACE